MSAGIVLGLVTGLTTGMLAVGIVLVYKAGRFVNLAHGELGALSAVLLATLVVDHGWSWWLAFPAVVAVGVGLGALVERTIVRPMRRQRRRAITYLLVTIGVGQLLLALTFIPALSPDKDNLFHEGYPLPFSALYRVAGADLTGAHVLILILVPLTVGGLAAFLRFTMLGKSIRAAASNPDEARTCGISVDRVNAITWGIAGALSAVTAVLLAPGGSPTNTAALGPGLLLRSLGAAALGGFSSIPAALVGGIGIGVVEQVTLSTTKSGSSAQVAVFVTVLLILLVRGRRISETAQDSGEVSEDRPPLRVPPAIADRFVVRSHRVLLGVAAITVALVWPHLPYFNTESHRFLLVMLLVFATVGIGLTMLLGWSGQVSLGHFALLGIGAFLAARFSDRGWSLPIILLCAGAAGAVAMTIIGLPALRLRGLSLAVTTLAFAVVAPAWLFVQPWFGAEGQGTVAVEGLGIAGLGTLDSQLSFYYAALALVTVTAIAAGALRRSVPGRLIVAARDNDRALATFGVTPATVKLATLAVSGFVAAAAGVVWGGAWHDVNGGLVQPAQSLALLAIPVLGGLGSVSGAIAGTVGLYVPTFFIGPALTGLFGEFGRNLGFQLALSGLGLILIPLTYPAGIAGAAQQGWQRILDSIDAGVARWRREEAADPLDVQAVSLDFGGIHALQDVSLCVRKSEIVGLIGPNGAGKTTLINVISGHLVARSGVIRINGHDASDLAPELRSGYGLGRSFQDARLFPGLTVTEAVQVALTRSRRVGFVASMFSAPWARSADARTRREAEELLASMGLTDWANTLTSDLSTGLRRLTDLAMQIAARPKVLLLDEPTAGVAQRETEEFGPILRRSREQIDCSILIVEHDMPMLMGLCDRIYAMEAGRVIAEGTPEEIRADPMVIASYLGTRENGKKKPTPRKRTKRKPVLSDRSLGNGLVSDRTIAQRKR